MPHLYLKIILQKHVFALFLSFFMTGHSNAQVPMAENMVFVTVSPLALADVFDGASLRLGAETKITHNISIAMEGGPYLEYLNATKINPSGYLIRPSVKYYLDRPKASGKYIALEYQYKNQGFNFMDSIVMPDEARIEKEYSIKRRVHSVVAKYGNLVDLGKNFLLEWYCGIGLRHIRASTSLTPDEEDGILTGEAGDCPIQEDIIRLAGTRIFPDFRAGIKIGYQVKL